MAFQGHPNIFRGLCYSGPLSFWPYSKLLVVCSFQTCQWTSCAIPRRTWMLAGRSLDITAHSPDPSWRCLPLSLCLIFVSGCFLFYTMYMLFWLLILLFSTDGCMSYFKSSVDLFSPREEYPLDSLGGLLQYSISSCIGLLLPCLAALVCRKCSLRTGALHAVSLWTTSANGIHFSFWFSGVYLALPYCALEASQKLSFNVSGLFRQWNPLTGDHRHLDIEHLKGRFFAELGNH